MAETALAHHEPAQLPEATAIIQMIERAAVNPAVDIDKMERLLAMQERVMERNARAAYMTALSEMQPRLPVINERGKIVTDRNATANSKPQSRYALWEDINEAIRPLLAEFGFALSFRTGALADGKLTVTGVLSHREGHQEETTIALPHDSSGSKNAVQAVGSSASYGKRYTAMALLNITSRGEDDDGRAAGGADDTPINAEQLRDLIALADIVSADKAKFCRFMKIDSFAALPAARLQEAVAALEAKRTKPQ